MVHPQKDLSKPTYSTQSLFSAIYCKAYFDTKPTNFLYLVILKISLTTCKFFSNEDLIALCCKMIILFMEFQQKHKSLTGVSRILFKLQCVDSTLLLVMLFKCMALFVQASTKYSLCEFNQVLITYSIYIGHGEQTTLNASTRCS